MKSRILFLLFLVLVPVLVQAKKLETVTLQLQWKHQFEYAGFYAAIEQGYYAEEGLDVVIKEIGLGIDPVQDVLDQKADYGITYSSIIADYLNGKPVVMLANIFKHSALILISQKELTVPSDLKNKKVMGTATELENSGITMMFHRFNMKVKDINVVAPTHSIDDFVNRRVDAMTAFITNQPYLLNQKQIKYTIHNPTSYGSQFYDVNLFTSQAELKSHPDRAEAFKRASIRGWVYAMEHSDEIVELILKRYNTQNKTQEALKYEAEITKSLVLPSVYPIGSTDCHILKQMGEDFVHLGMVPKESDLQFDEFLLKGSCADRQNFSLVKEEQDYLAQKKSIKMCADPDWMPFEKIEDGRHVGMSAEYMHVIESKLGVPIRLIPTKSWSESIEYAKARKCDIFSLAMSTPERKQYMNFTRPYLTIPLVIATKIDKFFIADIKEVLDQTLGVVKGYAFAELLKIQYPSIKLTEVDNIEDGLDRVEKGELYGFIDNLTTIGYQMQKNYIGTLKIAGRLDKNWELGIGVRNDDLVLLKILDKAISGIDERAKQRILNQWMSIEYEQGFDYSLFWKLMAVLAVVFAFVLYRYKIVYNHNKELKKYLHCIDQNVLVSSCDLDGKITDVSDALCHLSGYTKEELVGKNHNIFRHPDMPDELFGELWSTIKSGKAWRSELKNRRKDGDFYWADVLIEPIFDSSGKIQGYTAIRQDITDKKRIEELSITDPLTQLYNRLHLQNSFKRELEMANRYKSTFSVILMDVDNFKAINDTYGHDLGDRVLIDISNALKENIRSVDVLGRWGGEEFLIICHEANAAQSVNIAEKLRKAVEKLVFEGVGSLTCSFGISEYRLGEESSDDVVKRADDALYLAKESGKNKVIASE